MNEFELIDSILLRLGHDQRVEGLSLSAGDDAAVFDGAPWPIVTVDTMVEGIHWNPDFSSAMDVGFKLLACNLSDIAAMGGTPGPMLLALSLHIGTKPSFIMQVMDGIDEARRAHGLSPGTVNPIGGDVTRTTGPHVFTLVLFGKPICPGRVLTRSNAHIGDSIWVTGPLGSAAAGLALLESKRASSPHMHDLVERHRRPLARLDMARSLVQLPEVHAAIDLSDGLAGDIHHILDSSGVGAEIQLDQIPRHPTLDEAALMLQRDPIVMMLSGGEDYELLITAAPEADESLQLLGLTCIGRVSANRSVVYKDRHGRKIDLALSGYTHL